MKNPKEILNAYDLMKDDDGNIDATKLDDNQIDELIDTMGDMQEAIAILIAHKKQKAMIRLKATKEEKECEVFIRRMMERLDLQNFDCEYGKATTKISYRYDIDESNLPDEYRIPNHASIRSNINKGNTIDGVTKTDGYISLSIR